MRRLIVFGILAVGMAEATVIPGPDPGGSQFRSCFDPVSAATNFTLGSTLVSVSRTHYVCTFGLDTTNAAFFAPGHSYPDFGTPYFDGLNLVLPLIVPPAVFPRYGDGWGFFDILTVAVTGPTAFNLVEYSYSGVVEYSARFLSGLGVFGREFTAINRVEGHENPVAPFTATGFIGGGGPTNAVTLELDLAHPASMSGHVAQFGGEIILAHAPEPGTLLMGVGALALLGWYRFSGLGRRRRL